jgi:hypothetical protein
LINQEQIMVQIEPEAALSRKPLAIRIVGAAVLYFIIVFGVGFFLGPIRVLWLEPAIGQTAATLCEAPLLLAAIWFAALWVPRKFGITGNKWSLFKMGVIALGILILADIGVGTAIRGITWAEQFAYFATPARLMYLGLLVAFALMPALVTNRRPRTAV